MQFNKTRCHHAEVREHVTLAEDSAQGFQGLGNVHGSVLHRVMKRLRCCLIPVPCIFKCSHLSSSWDLAIVISEEHIVLLCWLKWRIQIHEINRLRWHISG